MRCSLLTLSGYLDGELEPARRGEVDGHLAGCDRCRNALGYLQEEAGRIGSLARVRIPDEAVHDFLAQLGLIGPDDTLSPRLARSPVAVASGTPPWLTGRATGASLPWAPRRDGGGEDLEPNQPPLPFMAELPLHALAQLPPGQMRPAPGRLPRSGLDEEEANLSGRSSMPSLVPRIPLVISVPAAAPPEEPPAPPPAPPLPPARTPGADPPPVAAVDIPAEEGEVEPLMVAGDGLVAMPAPSPFDPGSLDDPWAEPSPASLGAPGPDRPAHPAPPPAVEGDSVPWTFGTDDGGWSLPAAALHPPEAAPLPPAAPAPFVWRGHGGDAAQGDAPTPPGGTADREPPPVVSPREEAPPGAFPWIFSEREGGDHRSGEVPAGGGWPDAEEDPWSWAPRGDMPGDPGMDQDGSAAGIPMHPSPPPAPFDSLAAAERTDGVASWAALAAGSSASVDDADALVAHRPRPVRAPHPSAPSPVSWLRDKIALRLALMRATHPDEAEGMTGGPAGLRRGSPLPPGSAPHPEPPGQEAAPSGGGWQHPVESAGPITATAHTWSVLAGERASTDQPWPRGHPATTAEELTPLGEGLIVPDLIGDQAGERGHPGRHTRSLTRHGHAGVLGGTFPRLGERLSGARVQAHRALTHPRRWWGLAGAAVVLLLIVVLLIPLSGGAKSASSTLPRVTPPTVPVVHTTPTPQVPTPTPTVAPTATPSSAPAAYTPPPPLTIGGGGAGWQLAGVQYGQHATYLSVVLDLNPATQGAAGEPAAVITAPTAQTMVVTLTGVTLSSSAGTLGGGGVVTGVGVTTSGDQTALRLVLSQPVTVQTAGYVLPGSQGGTLVFYLNLA